MKCQTKANQKPAILQRVLLIGLLILGSANNSQAQCSIDSIKQEIIRLMQHTNRSAITRYHKCSKEFSDLIDEFLNTNNRESCAIHAARFETMISQFKRDIVDHPEFGHVRPMLSKLYQDLDALISILRRYSGEQGMIAAANLIVEFKPYEHLIPQDIKQKYPVGKFLKSVRHRLNIKAN